MKMFYNMLKHVGFNSNEKYNWTNFRVEIPNMLQKVWENIEFEKKETRTKTFWIMKKEKQWD